MKNYENSKLEKINNHRKNNYTNTIYDDRWKDEFNHISCSVNPSNLVAPVKVNQKFNKRQKNNLYLENQLLSSTNDYNKEVYDYKFSTENITQYSVGPSNQINLKSLYTLNDYNLTNFNLLSKNKTPLREYQRNAISSTLNLEELSSNKNSYIKNLVSPQYLSVKKYNVSKII